MNATDVRVGDSLYVEDRRSSYPTIPSFAPEHFAIARMNDVSPSPSSSAAASTQLDEEGVVQVLRDPDFGDQAPVLAAVGALQFEVATHRLENEFGAPVELDHDRLPGGPPHRRGVTSQPCGPCRASTCWSAPTAPCWRCSSRVYWLERLETEQPELTLDRLVAEGELRAEV